MSASSMLLAFLLAVLSTWVLSARGVRLTSQYSWPSKCFPRPRCDRLARYRTLDGSCNNLLLPSLGMANTSLVRLLPARYNDGRGSLPLSVAGGTLPLARTLRTLLFPDHPLADSVNTLALAVWGQILSHDVTLISTRIRGGCCAQGGRLLRAEELPSHCLVLEVPEDDVFYKQFGQTCFAFSRSETVNENGCIHSPFQQVSLQTHFLDLSMVYGASQLDSANLRAFKRGRLRVQEAEGGRQFLPNVGDATKKCPFASERNDTCFLAGDGRVNQQPPLTALHTLLLREHNLLCDQLFVLNPHWHDNQLFQEARRILVAQYQHITYKHFLPILLGLRNTAQFKLYPKDIGFGAGYDDQVNPGTLNMFTTAAFRSLHSIIPGHIEFPSETGRSPPVSKALVDVFQRPDLVLDGDNLDSLFRGFTRQAASQMDSFFTDQVTNFLFRPQGREFGLDLGSIDILRGRDHGLPAYNDVRKACGRRRAQNFCELADTMTNSSWRQLEVAYSHVGDVDLYVGGLMESPVSGSLFGPTFMCIVAEQFRRWRNGDRFFYEFGGFPGSFRLDQLEEIRKSSLAHLICRNSDRIKKIQRDAFSLPSSRNPMVKCKEITPLNLRLWKGVSKF